MKNQINNNELDPFHTQEKYFPDLDLLSLKLEEEREKGKTIVITPGCFRLFHDGHAAHFIYSKSIHPNEDGYEFRNSPNPNSKLVVAVNSDESIKQLGKPKLFPFQERIHILSCLWPIDYLCKIEAEFEPVLEMLINQIDIFSKGLDYYNPENTIKYPEESHKRTPIDPKELALLKEYDKTIMLTPHKSALSTTGFVEKVVLMGDVL